MRKLMIIMSLSYFANGWATSHHPQDFLKKISGASTEGKEIVQHFCANCHAVKPLIQIGAPRIHNSADWDKRFRQGMKTLFEHTSEGFNAMPPRGGCFECSDRQLMLAITEMLPENLKNNQKKLNK